MDLQNCKFCGEEIDSNIKRCPFCASSVQSKPIKQWIRILFSIMAVWPGFGQLLGVFVVVTYLIDEDGEKSRFGRGLLTFSIGLFAFWVVFIGLGTESLFR